MRMRTGGFTLLEILVVLGILGLLLFLLLRSSALTQGRLAAGRASAAACLRETLNHELDIALSEGRFLTLEELLARSDAPFCLRRACSSADTCNFAGPWQASSEADAQNLRIAFTREQDGVTWVVELVYSMRDGNSEIRIASR